MFLALYKDDMQKFKKNFTPFLLEAVEDRDVTFNQIQGS